MGGGGGGEVGGGGYDLVNFIVLILDNTFEFWLLTAYHHFGWPIT